jgi:exosortase/archaeosortase
VPTTDDWLDQQVDRALARQRSQVDTAKVIAVFTTGIAGTLVATSLQVGDKPHLLDHVGVWLLLATALAVVVVVFVDRLSEADHAAIIQTARFNRWDDEHLLRELRIESMTAVRVNGGVVTLVRAATCIQVILAIATGVIATVSLLL